MRKSRPQKSERERERESNISSIKYQGKEVLNGYNFTPGANTLVYSLTGKDKFANYGLDTGHTFNIKKLGSGYAPDKEASGESRFYSLLSKYSLDRVMANKKMTFMVWVKSYGDYYGVQTAMYRGIWAARTYKHGNSYYDYVWHFYHSNGNSWEIVGNTNFPINDGKWHFLCISYDNGVLDAYVDDKMDRLTGYNFDWTDHSGIGFDDNIKFNFTTQNLQFNQAMFFREYIFENDYWDNTKVINYYNAVKKYMV